LTLAGPNLKSGTVIKTVVNSTDLQISTETLATGSGLTFVVGQPSYLPLTMVGGVTTAGSNIVTVASTAGVSEGLALNGPNIPASTTVSSVDSSTQITMSANATADGLGLSITALSPMSLTVSGPSTTSPGEFGSTGAVVLTNETNFYGGRTVVNGGILSVGDIAAIGPNPAAEVANQVTLNGGTFRWTGTNGQFSQTRGLTLQGSGGTFDIVDPQANLLIQRGVVSQELYRGDLIKIGQGTLTFEGEASGNQSSFQGLLDVREGTVRMAGNNTAGAAGTSTIFGSNFTWADGTILRSGARLMLQMGNADGTGDWNFEEFLTTEGNNLITIGTLGSSVRPMNWNGPVAINGTTTFDVVPGQTFRLNNGGGFVQGSGDIIKDGQGQMEFRENIPDWKGGLTILQGRVLAANQADVLGTGQTVGKSITLGSREHQGFADLLIHPDLGAAGAVYEVNMPINVTFNPAQVKRIGGLQQQGQGGQSLAFNGNVTLNDNLILYYEEGNNGVPVGGEFVHIDYNGRFSDGTTTSGNLVVQTREGSPNANDSQNGRFYAYHKLNNDNSAWTGDLVISDNLTYNQDQNSIVRLGHSLALTEANDVTMNYNSILQAGGFSATIGSLTTKGGDGPFHGNAGTQSANINASTEIIENAAATPGTLRINQSTPANVEVSWDAMFRNGTLASHWVVPGQSTAAASLSIVKGGNGWSSLTLDNDYTGTTVVDRGILQVGRNGIGDTGAYRLPNVPGTTVLSQGTLAGTGSVHGATLVNGGLKPGDVAGEAMGTINLTGDVVFGATSVTTIQIQRASFNVPDLLAVQDLLYTVQRDLLLVDPSSTYNDELDTPVTTAQHDRVTIGGTVQTLTGARFSLLLNGYSPVAGDVFKLLDFASTLTAAGAAGPLAINVGDAFRFGGEGGTDLDLPFLGDSFQWDTGLFKEHGILSVVSLSSGNSVGPQPPFLTSRPGNTLVPYGQSTTFSIGAVGAPTITYTFKRNNVLLATAGAQTYTTPVITATNAVNVVGKYVAAATNPYGSKSSDGGIAANQAIVAAVDTTTTKSLYIAPNGTTIFTVATAAPVGVVLQYQWRKNGAPIANSAKYVGATTKSLTIKAFSATEAGVYTCLVTLPASGGGSARSLESGTNTALLAALPDLLVPTLPAAAVGKPYNSPSAGYQFPYDSDPAKAPTSWIAAGLPAGLTMNKTTGVISGVPTTATTTTIIYNKIYVTATGVAGVRKVGPYTINVAPIDPGAVGSFVGLVDRTGVPGTGAAGTNATGTRGQGARLAVTTTATASWTGTLTIGTAAYALKPVAPYATLDTSFTKPRGIINVVRKGMSTLTVTFEIDTTTHLMTGTVTDTGTTANINGWKLIWGPKAPLTPATARLGVHNFMATIQAGLEGSTTVPQGDSWATASVATTGTVTVSGKAADGTAIVTSAPMGPTGQFLVYQAMYPTTAQGTLMGTAQIDATPNVHAVTGSLTWSRPVQATTIKVYQTGWVTPLELDVTGGLYVKPATGAVVMGAKVPSLATPLVYNSTINSTITFFSDSGIPTSASAVNPNLNGNNTLPVLQGLRINSPGTVVAPTLATAGVLTTANPGSVTLLVNSATGSFSGSFKLKDGAVLRTVLYSGLIVPDVTTTANTLDAVGAGSYLLTGNPATAPDSTKSGRVTLLPIP
jgi:autotransporter-associated beta strand protein